MSVQPSVVRRARTGAGRTKSTFFRAFPDKREVLFGGETMTGLLSGGSSPRRPRPPALESDRPCVGRGRQASVHTGAKRFVLALTARIVPCMLRIMATVGSRFPDVSRECMPWPAKIAVWSGT